ENRRQERLRAVRVGPGMGDTRTAEPAGALLVAEDGEELSRETDLVAHDLAGLRDHGARAVQDPAALARARERTVDADTATRRGDLQVLHPHLVLAEDQVPRGIPSDRNVIGAHDSHEGQGSQ